MPSGHSALREGLWRGGEESQEIARAPRRYPTRCDERSRTEPSPRPAREPAHECAHPSDLSREIATPSSPDTPPHVGRTSGDSCGISAGPHCGGFCRRDIALPGRLLDLWAYHHGVQIDFSRPGKLTDNCVIETFTGSLRDECLNVHWFALLEEAKEKLEGWRRDSKPQKANAGFGPGNPSASPTRGLSL